MLSRSSSSGMLGIINLHRVPERLATLARERRTVEACTPSA